MVSEAYVYAQCAVIKVGFDEESTRPSVLPDLSNNHWRIVSIDMHGNVPANPTSTSFTPRVNHVLGTKNAGRCTFSAYEQKGRHSDFNLWPPSQ